ncbi:alpha/beta hydrolase fold [plant metagenome]|uniref:Alpha/beta hydrolase fold n=1 Tax=plant metagenome TaxID=1297885 RepID=A0A484Q2A2_9ZZZZ
MPTRFQVASGRAVLAAEVHGQGAPVVFLHANVCDSRMWQAQLARVSDTHRAIAYDRRGFGQTLGAAEPHSSVADLMAVIDLLAGGDTPVILVACSRGGRIALDAALRHPERVRGLALIAPGISGAPEPRHAPDITARLAAVQAARAAGERDHANALLAHLWLDGPLAQDGRVAGAARELFLNMNGIALAAPPIGRELDDEAAHARLADIGVPTLVAWGSLDFPHIQARCEGLAARLPDAQGVKLDGTAHLPSLERPEAISNLLTGFLARCEGARQDQAPGNRGLEADGVS